MNIRKCIVTTLMVGGFALRMALAAIPTPAGSGSSSSVPSGEQAKPAAKAEPAASPASSGSKAATILGQYSELSPKGANHTWNPDHTLQGLGLNGTALAKPKTFSLETPLGLIYTVRYGTTPESRCDAAEKLGNYPSSQVIEALNQAVNDSDASVSAAAYASLDRVSPWRAVWVRWHFYIVIGGIVFVVGVLRSAR